MTGFTRVCDGSRTMAAGDVVRLATKPAALGRVKYFAVPQVRVGCRTTRCSFYRYAGAPGTGGTCLCPFLARGPSPRFPLPHRHKRPTRLPPWVRADFTRKLARKRRTVLNFILTG